MKTSADLQKHIECILEIEEKCLQENKGPRYAVTTYLAKNGLEVKVATRSDSRIYSNECFKSLHGTWYRLQHKRR